MALEFKKYEYTELRDPNNKMNLTEMNDMLLGMNSNLAIVQAIMEANFKSQMQAMGGTENEQIKP